MKCVPPPDQLQSSNSNLTRITADYELQITDQLQSLLAPITSNYKLQTTDQLQSLLTPPPTATDAPHRDRTARRHVASGAIIFLFIKFSIRKLANFQSHFSA